MDVDSSEDNEEEEEEEEAGPVHKSSLNRGKPSTCLRDLDFDSSEDDEEEQEEAQSTSTAVASRSGDGPMRKLSLDGNETDTNIVDSDVGSSDDEQEESQSTRTAVASRSDDGSKQGEEDALSTTTTVFNQEDSDDESLEDDVDKEFEKREHMKEESDNDEPLANDKDCDQQLDDEDNCSDDDFDMNEESDNDEPLAYDDQQWDDEDNCSEDDFERFVQDEDETHYGSSLRDEYASSDEYIEYEQEELDKKLQVKREKDTKKFLNALEEDLGKDEKLEEDALLFEKLGANENYKQQNDKDDKFEMPEKPPAKDTAVMVHQNPSNGGFVWENLETFKNTSVETCDKTRRLSMDNNVNRKMVLSPTRPARIRSKTRQFLSYEATCGSIMTNGKYISMFHVVYFEVNNFILIHL